jgi:hypothetical protein
LRTYYDHFVKEFENEYYKTFPELVSERDELHAANQLKIQADRSTCSQAKKRLRMSSVVKSPKEIVVGATTTNERMHDFWATGDAQVLPSRVFQEEEDDDMLTPVSEYATSFWLEEAISGILVSSRFRKDSSNRIYTQGLLAST